MPRFDPAHDADLWADFAADGRLDRPDGRRRPPAPAGRSAAAVAATVDCSRPASAARSGSRWPGTCRWSSSGPGGAGGSATRATGGGAACGPGTWPRHALAETPDWRRRDRGLAGAYPRRSGAPGLVQGGPVQRAVLPRRRRHVLGGRRGRRPEPAADDLGRFALLECVDYPFYDTVDVDFYASFAVLELFPELELRGIRDLLAAIPVDDPEIVTSRRPARPPPQGRRHRAPRRRRTRRRPVPPAQSLSVPGRQRLEGPRARSSCCRPGGTPSPRVPTAMPSSARSGRPWTTS